MCATLVSFAQSYFKKTGLVEKLNLFVDRIDGIERTECIAFDASIDCLLLRRKIHTHTIIGGSSILLCGVNILWRGWQQPGRQGRHCLKQVGRP